MTIRTLLLLLAAFLVSINAQAEEDLLPADKAFSLTTRMEGRTLEATWRIATGYYLYRDKLKFESADMATRVGVPTLPPGQTKTDPFFGPSQIYTNTVTARVPIETSNGADNAKIRITSQGCNDPVGVCYPPIVKVVSVAAPAAPHSSSAQAIGLKSLSQSLGLVQDDDEVVDPEKAFAVHAMTDGTSIHVRFTIDDCCYLYRHKMAFSIAEPAGTRLGTFQLPPGEVYNDEYFGRTEVYRKRVDARLPLMTPTMSTDIVLRVTYQGCSEKGVKICYPPTTRDIPVSVGSLSSANAPPTTDDSVLFALIGAFIGGLLLTFTPCVLPLIPILSGVIVGAEGTRLTRTRGGLLSYTYVLGTALTYTIAGAVAGATGAQLQAYFQNVWAIGIFAAVLVVLALSMFGLFELQMPASIQTLLHRHSSTLHQRTKGKRIGEFIGVFLLGAASALIIGACVAPVLAFTLGTAIASRDPWLGAALMFALAHGQGAILVLVGVSEGFLLPRAGPWMERVKHVFGALLIAVAIYLLGTLPQVPVLFLWAAFLIVSAVYLGATQSLPGGASGWRYLQKGFATLLLAWGFAALLGGFLGGRELLNPLPLHRVNAAFEGAGDAPKESLFLRVASPAELDAALLRAQQQGKPVLLDYYATWCTDCVRMERSTFLDPAVREAIATRFIALQVDVTDVNDVGTNDIRRRYDVYGPPALLFFGSDGVERKNLRAYGYLAANELLKVLSQL